MSTTPRVIIPTEDVTTVVSKGKTIMEQIAEFGVGSIVLIEKPCIPSPYFPWTTVIQRTGRDGWLGTRPHDPARGEGPYLHLHDGSLERYIKRQGGSDPVVTVLREGRRG